MAAWPPAARRGTCRAWGRQRVGAVAHEGRQIPPRQRPAQLRRGAAVIWVQYTLFGLGVGAMFALLAAGIVLVYRASGVLNFAHASMAMICAYVNFDLIERAHLPVGVALIPAMVCGAVLGVVAQR